MIGLKAHNVFQRENDTWLMLGIEGLGTYERAMAVLAAIRAVIAREERKRRRAVRVEFQKAERVLGRQAKRKKKL